jgi:hypothetical protein
MNIFGANGPGGLFGSAASSSARALDWPARAADAIESTVATVHDRVVRPLLLLARAIVFGILVGSMALALTILLSVALVRLLDDYWFSRRVWASEAIVGGLITLLGLVAWSQRRVRRRA